MPKWLDIFAVGNNNGQEFTQDDLISFLSNFNRRLSESASKLIVPLVKGHPKTDDPAYGWTEQIRFQNGVLQAKPKNVDPEFQKEVESEKLPHISVRIRKLMDGTWDLIHIGFLGAVEPAVNLPAVEFNKDKDNLIDITSQFSWEQEVNMPEPTQEQKASDFAAGLIKEKEKALSNAKQEVSELKGSLEDFSKKSTAQSTEIQALTKQIEEQKKELLDFQEAQRRSSININVNQHYEKWNAELNAKVDKERYSSLMLEFNENQQEEFNKFIDSIVKISKDRLDAEQLEKPAFGENDFAKKEPPSQSIDGLNMYEAIKRSQGGGDK